jgi:hypothetical protein
VCEIHLRDKAEDDQKPGEVIPYFSALDVIGVEHMHCFLTFNAETWFVRKQEAMRVPRG